MIDNDSMPGLRDMDDVSSGGDRSDRGSSRVESEDSKQCLLGAEELFEPAQHNHLRR